MSLIAWILISIPIFYQYSKVSSLEKINKGGTFVEGIFKNTSYLPYLSNDPQSFFYQGLLFKSCLNYSMDEEHNITYTNSLCNVSSKDEQVYYVNIVPNPNNTRSDGVLISLQDIYFTYKNILINNVFNLKHLEGNSDIQITKENDKLKIVFPKKTKDNRIFFTNYILPNHALVKPNINMYQQSFALEPIYTSCARIHSQSTDKYSLIFDLTQCKDTHLGFYQIKQLQNFDNFSKLIKEKKGESIIDIYEGDTILPGYSKSSLHTNRHMVLFFNTQSPKLLVRIRRALGGLINYSLQKDNIFTFSTPYKKNLFNKYLSTGSNIKSFIESSINKTNMVEKSIKDSNIKNLPKKIEIKDRNQALAYQTQSLDAKTLSFSVNQSYDKIGIQSNNDDTLYYPKSYNKKKKSFNYILGKEYSNLKKGTNGYTIYGFLKNKKIKLASIKVYALLLPPINTNFSENIKSQEQEKINILYYHNTNNQQFVTYLKKLFSKYNIIKYFKFEGFDNENKIHGTLSNGNYDIFIGAINSSLQENFYNFLDTDNPTLNPSKYTNVKLSSLLEQYQENSNHIVLKEINDIYSKNIPFMILGEEKKTLAIKEDILKKLGSHSNLHEYNWRKKIYNNLTLTKNSYIDSKGLFNLNNFYNYITQLRGQYSQD